MSLDLTAINAEAIDRFDRSLKRVRKYFEETLFIVLGAAYPQASSSSRERLEDELDKLFSDESRKATLSFMHCLKKMGEMVRSIQ